MLGNIRFIGELYKQKMLTEKIMHECLIKLLGEVENPDEDEIECLCKLLHTIGKMIDHHKAKPHMDQYFVRMTEMSQNTNLANRASRRLRPPSGPRPLHAWTPPTAPRSISFSTHPTIGPCSAPLSSLPAPPPASVARVGSCGACGLNKVPSAYRRRVTVSAAGGH